MADAFDALYARIAVLLSAKPRVIAALDGMAASGKTTLARRIQASMPGCFVVHMDDFTLPFELRHAGYFDEELTNADTKRFEREVLSPLLSGKGAVYRPYRCHPVPGFGEPIVIPGDWRCILIEGAYCLHPDLFGRYDLRVVMTISPEAQRSRILERNGTEGLARFERLWIPMENRHIREHDLLGRCDLRLSGE